MIAGHNQIEAAIEKLVAELREGLKHGFFEYRLIGEIGRGGKRELIFEAGKKYKFTIPEEDLEWSASSGNADP